MLLLLVAVILTVLVIWRRSGARFPRVAGRESGPPAADPSPGLPVLLIPEDEAVPDHGPAAGDEVLLGLDPSPVTASSGGERRWLVWLALALLAGGLVLTGVRTLAPSREAAWGEGWSTASPWSAPDPAPGLADADELVAVDPETGMRLVVWSGNHQMGLPGRPLERALSVLVRDSADRPVPGAEVRFRVAEGGGRVEPLRVVTGDLGLATTTWWLGTDPDSLLVVAYVAEPAAGLLVELGASHREGTAPPRESGLREIQLAETDPVTDEADSGTEAAGAPEPAEAEPVASAASAAIPVRTRSSVAAGGAHTCRLDRGTGLVCWGGAGQATGGVPAVLPRLQTLRAGLFHTCGVTGRGTVYCWSSGRPDQRTPAAPGVELELPGGAVAVDVVAGSEHSCALGSEGDVYCWGGNAHGQLGTGGTSGADRPIRVEGLPPVVQLAAGWLHTCALAADGRAFCWGANARGQIGDGGSGDATTPTPVDHPGAFTFLASGSAHSCGLTQGGQAWCWGGNEHGQLGTGSGELERRPRRVAGDYRFRALVTGGVHTCGLTGDGQAWCWGRNTFGQLGNGTTTGASLPAPVSDSPAFVALDAGGAHTCGEAVDRRVYCWGNNVQGQVGDGSREDRLVPVITTQEQDQ